MWLLALCVFVLGCAVDGLPVGLAAGGFVFTLKALLALRTLRRELARTHEELERTRETAFRRLSELTARLAALEVSPAARVHEPDPPAAPAPVEPEGSEEADAEPPPPHPVVEAAPPPPQARPLEAAHPGVPFEQRLKQWLLGDNPVARAGVLVLLVGIALTLRLMAEHDLFPIEARLSSVAVLGTFLVGFGYRERTRRQPFARLLQGAGIATLYLTVFFAYRTFQLLPSSLTFALLVLIVLASGLLAVAQDALSLSFVGTLGGFAAPVLASSGGGSHVALFSYYLVLNVSILSIAWFKDWRLLTTTGFVATFGVGTAWGALRYQPDLFASTEPFLLSFYAIYVAIQLLSALRRPQALRGALSASLTFGLPLVTLGLQTSLAGERDWIVAVTALAMAALYVSLARALVARHGAAAFRGLVDGYLALTIGLATLAVPYAIDSRAMVSATWVLEAAGLYWVGVRRERLLSRIAAMGLLFTGLVAARNAGVWQGLEAHALPVLNAGSLSALLLLATALFVAWVARRAHASLPSVEPLLVQALVPLAFVFVAVAVKNEVDAHFADAQRVHAFMALFACSSVCLSLIGRRLDLTSARFTALSPLLVSSLLLVLLRLDGGWLWQHGGALALPVVLIAHALVLGLAGPDRALPVRAGHVVLPLFCVALAACLARDLTEFFGLAHGFRSGATGLALGLSVVALARPSTSRFAREKRHARDVCAGAAGLFWIHSLTLTGDAAPIAFVTLLNPLELAELGLLGLAFLRVPALGAHALREVLLAGATFALLNTVFARTVHHYTGVPYVLAELGRSDVFQVGLSILWAVVGLLATVWASLRGRREVWVVGSGLLAVVVLKLFLVDLARVGQISRILSFLGVGALLLAVGYLAPLPPTRRPPGDGEPNA